MRPRVADLAPRSAASRTRTALIWSAALALAAILLYYSLRGTDWPRVGELFVAARWGFVATSAAVASLSIFLRAIRWRLLLNAEGAVSVRTAFWATCAGYFGNNFLPVRGGEVVRTLMISSQSSLTTAYVFTTALSERAVDAVALVAISALVLLTLPSPPGWLATAARPFAVLGILAVVTIAALPACEPLIRRFVGQLRFSQKASIALMQILERVLRAFRAFHDTRRLITFVSLTAVIWTLDAVATVIGAHALGFSIPINVAFLLIAGLGLGSALPSTPGYVGIYQFVAVTVLQPFGFTRTDAIAYILFAQALSYLLIALWGSIGFVQYRKLSDKSPLSASTAEPSMGELPSFVDGKPRTAGDEYNSRARNE